MDINLYTPHASLSVSSLTGLENLKTEDLFEILRLTRLCKRSRKAGENTAALEGKIIASVLDLPSVRTRAALELAVKRAGGDVVELPMVSEREKSGESLFDIVLSLETFGFDAFFIRTNDQKELQRIASAVKKPVVNGMTSTRHPTQVLSDLFTIWERTGKLAEKKLAYVGRPTAVTNSLLIGAAKCGMSISVACPQDKFPPREIVECALQYGEVLLTENVAEAVRGADVVYTDGYADLNFSDRDEESRAFADYCVTESVMALAKPDALFMHTLPVTRGKEAEDAVLSSKNSAVLEQTENRLFTMQALLALLTK